MIKRELENKLNQLAGKFPVVTLTGPRKSGKITLIRHVFNEKPYVSFEDPDNFEYAITEPRGLLNDYPDGAIFDEVQKVPALFSYIQTITDVKGKNGMFLNCPARFNNSDSASRLIKSQIYNIGTKFPNCNISNFNF